MKHKLFYLLAALLLFGAGCAKTDSPPPAIVPVGTFSGAFTRVHTNQNTGKSDSLKSNIVLQMEATTGFKVTGDTSILHAGSHGSYTVYSTNSVVQFFDSTYPASGTPTKVHLSGIYSYIYDGSTLHLLGHSPGDTLSFHYNLIKTGD